MNIARTRITARTVTTIFLALGVLTNCTSGARETVTVRGAGPEDFLRLRAGPGLGYKVILGLPDGTTLIRRDCVTEVGQLWCRVALADASGITGYVSADYITAP